MAKKKLITGFKGVALSPVIKNDILSYQSSAAEPIPYAGSMTRTAKETTQDFYYDDALYAQLKEVLGEDAEIRFAEMSLEDMAKYGLGTYDADTNKLEAAFTPKGDTYSLRCITDTVDKLPFYFNYRCFDLTGIRFDNFTTKGSSITAADVIINGIIKAPNLPTLEPWAVMGMLEDGSNKTACETFMATGETFPVVPGGGED